jgi:hypothetical protein
MLEQELMEPFYQIKGFELPAAIAPAEQEIRQTQDKAAKANWAKVPADATRPINSRQEKMSEVRSAQRTGFERIGQWSAIGLILIPLALWAVVITLLWRSGIVKRALVRLAIVSGVILLVGICLAGWLISLTEALYYLDPEEMIIPLAIVLGLTLLIFVVYAWAKHDQAARFLSLLTLAWAALLYLLILAADLGDEPEEELVIAGLVAYLLIPGAYLLFGQARWVQQRRFGGGVATAIGALSALPVALILPATLFFTVGGGMVIGSAPVMAPVSANLEGDVLSMERAVEEGAEKEAKIHSDDEQATGEAPRLRQYFPETLYWAPEVVTDERGFASLDIPMADSITTWRLTALASSQDGRLGFTTRGVRVFQDFFVDIDLPVSLTQGDEISIPVGVFNYLPEAQEVRLVVEPEPWFELLGQAEQTLTIASNDIEVVYFPIRVKKFGRQRFQVTAWGSQMSDAIRREVNVVPDGKEFRLTESDWLRESKEVAIQIPAEAVPETPYIEVKIYPGVMAQVVEGLEKILRLPHG